MSDSVCRIDAPIMIFEVNAKAAKAFGQTSKSCFEFLESLENPKYSFFEITVNGIKKLTLHEIEYTNVIAVPEAKRNLYLNIFPD